MRPINPFMPTGAFNICCPRDAVSRTANVESTGRHKWVNMWIVNKLYSALVDKPSTCDEKKDQ